MSYSIVVPKSVQKQLDKLPEQLYQRILKKIRLLADDPRPDGSLKLKGMEAEYRIRISDLDFLS
jgi:mRNA interferase RelE/StbE